MTVKSYSVRQLRNARLFVAPSGGVITAVSKDGEVLYEAGVQTGRHYVDEYLSVLTPTDKLQFSDGIAVFRNGSNRLKSQNFGDVGLQTGANPDFRPTAADRERQMMQRQVQGLADKLQRQTELLQRVAQQQQQQVQVIDNEEQALVEVEEAAAASGGDVSAQDQAAPEGQEQGV